MGFRFKLIISYAAVIFLTLLTSLLLFGFLAQQIQQGQRRDAEERLARQTREVQDNINNLQCPFSRCSPDIYRNYLSIVAGLLDARILIIDERKTVQIDTNTTQSLENTVLNDYKPVPRDNKPHLGSIPLNGVNYIYYALPGPTIEERRLGGTSDDSKMGATRVEQQVTRTQTDVVLSVREATLNANWDDLVKGMLLVGLGVLALATVVAILIARGVSRPLIRMTRASEAIAKGDYSQQLPEPKGSKDEMGRLAVSFNRMAREVAKSQQTMRDFVANVSHELKTPLTSIQGFSQAIFDGTADDRASLEHSAAVINAEAARMRRLVDELLDLSRIESGQIELVRREVDLERLLERVVGKLSPQASQKQVVIESFLNAYRKQMELPPNSYGLRNGPMVMGDSDRLEQIFTNILDNAIKYSPPGGEVSLKLYLNGSEGSKPSGNGSAGRYYWATVEISNRGPLIPADQLPRIFERFYKLDKSRAKRRGESTGLGLAIAKELIEAHRGTVSVTSYPVSLYPVSLPADQTQEGLTTFTVSLPLLALPATTPYQPTVASNQ